MDTAQHKRRSRTPLAAVLDGAVDGPSSLLISCSSSALSPHLRFRSNSHSGPWLVRRLASCRLNPSVLSPPASRRRRREWLPAPVNGAQTLHALCLDPARMILMMEFMMKLALTVLRWQSAAGTRTGTQVQVQVRGPGLGLQHQMACLTNNLC